MHTPEHFIWRRKALYRCRQIRVWTSHSREQRPDCGKSFLEENALAVSDQAARLSEIQDAAFSAGSEHPRDFTQSRVVVGQVSETECRCHQIEVSIGKWQPKRVGFDPLWGPQRRASSLLRRLRRCALQHGMRKIRTENLRSSGASAPPQSESHVSGAATKIQHASIGTLQNGIELARGAPPPQPVNVERKNVIQQVVARRNRGEHLADGRRRRLAIACTCGSRAYDSLIHFLSHMTVASGAPGALAQPPI